MLALLSIMPAVAAANHPHPARSLVGRWTAPPLLPPLPSFSDGPYAGNGDLGVTLGGPPQRAVQYVAMKSFWTGAFFESPPNLQRRWGMLLAASVVWDAPALKGARYGATQELWSGRMNQTLGGGFQSSTFVGQADGGQGGNFYVTEFGVTAGGGGAKALPLPLRILIRPGNPDVSMKQNYNPGTTSGGTEYVNLLTLVLMLLCLTLMLVLLVLVLTPSFAGSDDGVVWTARNNTNITGDASNPYTNDTFAFTKLTMGLAARISSADGGHDPVVTRANSGKTGTHTLSMTLQPGRRYALTVWVACREWGNGDAVGEARANLKKVSSSAGRAAARATADAWWERHWATTPVVKHFSAEAEQYYYGTLYTMASSKRAGTVGIDRQGPFMTQDNAIWYIRIVPQAIPAVHPAVIRPYICNNYNLQAPYYGMLAANMSWTLPPMLNRVMESVPLFKSRARKLLVNVVAPKHGKVHKDRSCALLKSSLYC